MSAKNVTVTVASVVVAEAGYINWIQGTGTTYTVAVNAQTDYITVTDAAAVTSGGTPGLVLSTSNAAGNATTFLRTNDQLALFDATVPVAAAQTAATGSAAFAARRDHIHPVNAASSDSTLPTGYIAQTYSRANPQVLGIVWTSGKLTLEGLYLPACTVTNIIVAGGGAAVAPTHWWFALYDGNRNLLSQTADQTSTAWGANTIKTVALGAAQTIAAGWYYIGFMMTAGTMVQAVYSWPAVTNLMAIPPILGGDTSDTGLTTTAPSTAATITASTVRTYRAVS